MTYLILGSNSFAGGSLIDYLLTKGEVVIGISRSPQTHGIFQPYRTNANKKQYQFIQADINNNFCEIKQLIDKHKPCFIIDFAGQGMVAESWNNSEQWYLTNIVSKVKLHDYLRQCDFLERYIRVSTPEVYGNTETDINEAHHYNPSTPYAVSHAAIDMSLIAFYKQFQFPVILTRFANFYGPYQQLYRIIPRTMIYAHIGKQLQLHGGGHAKRAFIHGHDVASAIDTVISKGNLGEVYHFSSGESMSIRALVDKIYTAMKVDVNPFVMTTEDRPGKDANYAMNYSKARTQLDWLPKYSLEQGLEETLTWIGSNIEIIKKLPLEYIHKP